MRHTHQLTERRVEVHLGEVVTNDAPWDSWAEHDQRYLNQLIVERVDVVHVAVLVHLVAVVAGHHYERIVKQTAFCKPFEEISQQFIQVCDLAVMLSSNRRPCVTKSSKPMSKPCWADMKPPPVKMDMCDGTVQLEAAVTFSNSVPPAAAFDLNWHSR